MQAVILAGGKGTRLAERLRGKPKPLVDVLGKPLLQRQIELLRAQGVGRFVVLISHGAEQIEAFFAANDDFRCEIVTVRDAQPRGTAGATLAALDLLDPQFLVVYGDTLFDIDVHAMWDHHEQHRGDGTLFLHPNDHPHDSDLVEVDNENNILAFHGYPHPPGVILGNQVNAAFYILEREALEPWREKNHPLDFAKQLFPEMLRAGATLIGYRSFEYIKDCGTPARVDKVERHLREGVVERCRRDRPQTCVFLDRDGTLNESVGYVRSPDDLRLLPGVGPAIRRLNELEYRVVVVTNQPVVARGDVSEDELRHIHAKLEKELGDAGGFVDRIYYCPHHPDGGFPGERAELKRPCDCRKPMDGLLRRADLLVDLERSWMVGDSTADILAAERFGIASILVRTGDGGADGKYVVEPDFVADGLAAAVDFIDRVYPALEQIALPLTAAVDAGDVVMVGGLARSGKTVFSATIARMLRRRGLSVSIAPIDRWISPELLQEAGVHYRDDLAEAMSMLADWFAGGYLDVTTPFYDHRRSDPKPATRQLRLSPDGVLIIEGRAALLANPQTQRRFHRVYMGLGEKAWDDGISSDATSCGADAPYSVGKMHAGRHVDEGQKIDESASFANFHLSLDAAFARLNEKAT